ncbi:MAG: DNA-methyltransferase, partial [Nitrososphaerales archaeon]
MNNNDHEQQEDHILENKPGHLGLLLHFHSHNRLTINSSKKAEKELETDIVKNCDVLSGLNQLPSKSINLLYLDPPFFSNRDFEGVSLSGRVLGFKDKWTEGLDGYVRFMSGVLKECHRVLKTTGSLYLHCDWHASHYLKVELDKIFGYSNFRNEIIWKRHNAHNDTKQGGKIYGRIHDVILFYTKTNSYTWNPIYQNYLAEYVAN